MNGWHRKSRTGRADRRGGGFALTELLVVIVVLGILATLAVIATRHVRQTAEESTCAADASSIERAAVIWLRDEDATPTMDDLVTGGLLRHPSSNFTIDDAGAIVPLTSGACDGFDTDIDVAIGSSGSGGAGTSGAGGAGGGAGTGGGSGGPTATADALEFTLTWTGNADLDVWVESPSGELIGWTVPSDGPGQLDLDIVPPTPDAIGPHVERVTWPAGTALPGEYAAWAAFQSVGWGSQAAADFILTVRQGDIVIATTDGPIGEPGTTSSPLLAQIIA